MQKVVRVLEWTAAIFFLSVGIAAAGTQSLTLPNPLGSLGCGSFGCVTSEIINLIFTVAVPLCAIMVLVGGFQMMTSSGDPEKFSKGRKTILYAAGGFIVILFAKGIAHFIQTIFT